MVAQKPRQQFPNAPVAGFWPDLQSAALDYVAVHPRTPELLAAHRAGVKDARDALLLGFRWLCYQASRNPKWDEANTEGLGWRNDLWGTLEKIFRAAVDRLASDHPKHKKARNVTDVDAYLRSELSRAPGIYKREITLNLLVPRSTKSDRKHKHQPEAIPLKRQRYIEQEGRLTDPLKLLAMPEPDHDPRLNVTDVDDLPADRLVWHLLRYMSERDVAKSTGLTIHAVKQIKADMIARVRAAA